MVYNSETASLPLSTANVYCVRSLVPIEKKSTFFANSFARMAAEGISIIIPTGILSFIKTPSFLKASATFWSSSLAASNSSIDEIIGNIIARFPYSDARSNARSCVWNSSFLFRHNRIARKPRNGLLSSSISIAFCGLSPPMSSVLTITRFVPITSKAFLYSWNCSSSEGNVSRFKYKNSLLKSPIPSAPSWSAFRASAPFPIFP